MSENFHYYGKHSHKKHSVGQIKKDTNIKKSIRLDTDNYELIMDKVKYINSLDENMKTDFSKTLNNILSDYFLDERTERQAFEVSDI